MVALAGLSFMSFVHLDPCLAAGDADAFNAQLPGGGRRKDRLDLQRMRHARVQIVAQENIKMHVAIVLAGEFAGVK